MKADREPPPILLAMKALLVAPLSTTAKSVGGVLLDCYNVRTGRLDPSIRGIARRLGKNPKTVVAAIEELSAGGYFERHKGQRGQRSAYTPNFAFTRLLVLRDFEPRREGMKAPDETSPLHPANRPSAKGKRERSVGDVANTFADGQGVGETGNRGVGESANRSVGENTNRTLRINSLNQLSGAEAENTAARAADGTALPA